MMSDTVSVEVTDADYKALKSAVSAIKSMVSTFGGTDSELFEELVTLKALKKRIKAAQAAAN